MRPKDGGEWGFMGMWRAWLRPQSALRKYTHARDSPSPTICSQSKRSPSHPADAWRQVPPSIVPDNSILLGSLPQSQSTLCWKVRGQRPKVKLGRGSGHLGQVRGSSLAPPPGKESACLSLGAAALGSLCAMPLHPCCLSVGPPSRSPSVSVC